MIGYFDLKNKWFIGPLFLFLLTYAILRAYFVDPLLDEIGTFYWYIQTGKILGGDAALDANNHILNSFFSRGMYLLVGDHFFAFRLLSMASFVLYFFATKHFVQKNIDKSVAWVVFLALNMIPWIFEYFSYSRGYGSALALFFTAFCVLQKWQKTQLHKHYLLLLILFTLTIVSNLSMLIPSCFLFAYSLLQMVVHWKNIQSKRWHIILICCFISFIILVYFYLKKLKAVGALWWGSKEGLWEVTGKSLAKNVLFNDNDIWQIILYALFGIIGFTFVMLWLRKKSTAFIDEPVFWTTGLFFLAILSSVFMALFMNVNYPMDRVGMYLVPLFILVLGINFAKFKILKWTLIGLLWFPISFVWKMNLYTSVFSPADRFQTAMYARIEKELKPEDVLSGDYTASIIYAYNERFKATHHMGVDNFPDTLTRGDYYLSWIFEMDWPNYTCIYREPVSGTRLYKRISKPRRRLLLDTIIQVQNSAELYVPVVSFNLKKYGNPEIVQTWTNGNVSLDKPSIELNLIHAVIMKNSENKQLHSTRFHWYSGDKLNYHFNFPNHPLAMDPDATELLLFLINPQTRTVSLKNLHVRIYSLETRK